MLRNDDIYDHVSFSYEQLISKEDRMGNIPKIFAENIDFEGKDVIDLGAGTGRLACMLAPKAKSVAAMDFAPDMLKTAAAKLTQMGLHNWTTKTADLKSKLPAADESADLITAGWTICYIASTNDPAWRENLERLFGEIKRVLRPGGKLVIFETMGAGCEQPAPPDFLNSYFAWLEEEMGLTQKTIPTDFAFDSALDAEQLCGDFFGDELRTKIHEANSAIVPAWTGVWFGTLK